MERTLVAIVGSRTLFEAGMMSLLQGRPDLELIAFSDQDNDLYHQLHEAGPSFVLLEHHAASAGHPVDVARVLRECRQARVLMVDLDEPRSADIFRSDQLEITSAADLVTVIAGTPGSEDTEPRAAPPSG